MRIALVIDNLRSNVMSGSHFEQAILQQVDSIEDSDKSFFVITNSDITLEKPVYARKIKYFSTKNYKNRLNIYPDSFLTRLVQRVLSNRFSKILIGNNRAERLKKQVSESPLTKALFSNKIDIVWNVYSNEMVDVPYIATCLDCFDLTDPYLPENNRSGYWVNWNNKSFHYYRRASFILASTQVLKKQLQMFYGIDGAKIIVNPFFVPKLETAQTTFASIDATKIILPKDYLFYPARYTPQKNHIVIIEALRVLKYDRKMTPHVIFCGRDGGNLEYLKFKAKEYDLTDQCTFLGLIDFPSLVHLYKHAKALVYTSLVGPDNLPPLEAFSYNCPVIASNVSGAIEQLGNAALLFEPTDESKLAEHIISIYQNQGLVSLLRARGSKICESNSVENYVNTVLKILTDFSKYHRAWSDKNYASYKF